MLPDRERGEQVRIDQHQLPAASETVRTAPLARTRSAGLPLQPIL
mgnify:FL=1